MKGNSQNEICNSFGFIPNPVLLLSGLTDPFNCSVLGSANLRYEAAGGL